MKSRKTEKSTLVLLGGAMLKASQRTVFSRSSSRSAPASTPCRRRGRRAGKCASAMTPGIWRRIWAAMPDAHHEAAKYARHLADQEAHDIAADLTARAAQSFPGDPRAAIQSGRESGQRWFDRARHSASHLQDVGGQLWNRASHKAQSWLGHEEHEGFGAGTLLSSTVGCCMVGAGLMYFLDPKQGRTRRAWMADKTTSCVHRTGRAMRGIGKDVSNRLRGMAHETESRARSFIGRGRADSDQLVRQIRSGNGSFDPARQSGAVNGRCRWNSNSHRQRGS